MPRDGRQRRHRHCGCVQQGAESPGTSSIDLITDGEQRENADADGKPKKNSGHWDSQGRLVQDTVHVVGKFKRGAR